MTGIGHATDRSILDDVAWRAADTPSKALGTVKAICQERLNAIRANIDAEVDRLKPEPV